VEIFLFGCKDTTLHVSRLLIEKGAEINLITISPAKAKEQKVAGYEDLTRYPELFKSIYISKRYDLKDNIDYSNFKKYKCNIGFAIGWQRLIPKNILDLFECGIFGMHGSSRDLPFGKGRSPLNWSLIEDRKWFYTNLFKYESGVDNGPIIAKECFSINKYDTAESLHYKNLISFTNIVFNNWEHFINNNLESFPQPKLKGSFYPKREPEDSIIDWNDDIFRIERFIRAVSPPFNGAFSFLHNKKIIFLRVSIFYTDMESHSFKKEKFGEICQIFPNGKFIVRANGGVFIVHDYKYEESISKGTIISPQNLIKRFKTNNYCFYDI